jgi:hypothetical protein
MRKRFGKVALAQRLALRALLMLTLVANAKR